MRRLTQDAEERERRDARVLQLLRQRAEEEVVRDLFRMVRDLVDPFFQRYNLLLWDPETLEVTPAGRAVLRCLVDPPRNVAELPEELVEPAMDRVLETAAGHLAIPEAQAVVPAEEGLFGEPWEPPPFRVDVREGLVPAQMSDRYRVPPYTEVIYRQWASKVWERDECLVWRGGRASSKTPVFTYKEQNFNAKRTAYWFLRFTYISRRLLPTTCGDTLCVNPDHMQKGRGNGVPQ